MHHKTSEELFLDHCAQGPCINNQKNLSRGGAGNTAPPILFKCISESLSRCVLHLFSYPIHLTFFFLYNTCFLNVLDCVSVNTRPSSLVDANAISAQRGQALLQGAKEPIKCQEGTIYLLGGGYSPHTFCMQISQNSKITFQKISECVFLFPHIFKIVPVEKMQALIPMICFLLSGTVSMRAGSGDLWSERLINDWNPAWYTGGPQ